MTPTDDATAHDRAPVHQAAARLVPAHSERPHEDCSSSGAACTPPPSTKTFPTRSGGAWCVVPAGVSLLGV